MHRTHWRFGCGTLWLALVMAGLALTSRADFAAQLFPNGPAPYPAYGGEARLGRVGDRLLLSLRIDDPARTEFHHARFRSPTSEVVSVPLDPPMPFPDPAAPPGSPGWGHVDYSAFFSVPEATATAMLAGTWIIEVGEPGANGSLSSRPLLPLPAWTWRHPTPANREPRPERALGIAHGAGRYVALIAGTTSSLASSPDGVLWDSYPANAAESLLAVAWAGDRFLAVGSIESSMLVLASTDGVTWTQRRYRPRPDNGVLTDIAFQNGIYALQGYVHYALRTTGTLTLTSRDAEQWDARAEPVVSGATVASGHRNLVAGNGLFLRLAWTVTAGAGQPEVSTNALDWIASPRLASPLTSVAFGQGTFVAIDVAGEVLSSRDGRSWSTLGASPVAPGPFVTIGFAGGAFFLPSGNALAASLNGASWSWSRFPSNVVVTGVARGRETFCASGYRVRSTPEMPSGPDEGAVIHQSGAPEPWATRLGRPRFDATGRGWIAAQGPPGVPLALQRSADLRTWHDLASHPNPEGLVEFEIVPDLTRPGALGFRARQAPPGTAP